jgi:hypothetical protein
MFARKLQEVDAGSGVGEARAETLTAKSEESD